MSDADPLDLSGLPSSRQLLISTGIALAIASAALAVVVLPAEYGIDPTRIGSLLGLTEHGRLKRQQALDEAAGVSLLPTRPVRGAIVNLTPPVGPGAVPVEVSATVEPPAADDAASPASDTPTAPPTAVATSAPAAPAAAVRTDRTSLTLEPDEGAEIKMTMTAGGRATYSWSTDGEPVVYDTHGDGEGVTYRGYGKGTDSRMQGTIVAEFTGHHGWYWRNRGEEPVTITLETRGDYQSIDFID